MVPIFDTETPKDIKELAETLITTSLFVHLFNKLLVILSVCSI